MARPRVSAPGKYSRRTDRPATPGLGGGAKGETDLQYGDVGQLEAGSKIARLSDGKPSIAGPLNQRSQGAPPVPGGIPPFLLEPETAQPDVPSTEGLSTGPGAGPEAIQAQEPPQSERDVTLLWISQAYGNQDAYEMLLESRQARPPLRPAAPPPMELPTEPTPGYAGQDVFAPDLDEAIAEPGPAPGDAAPPAEDTPAEMPAPTQERPVPEGAMPPPTE